MRKERAYAKEGRNFNFSIIVLVVVVSVFYSESTVECNKILILILG